MRACLAEHGYHPWPARTTRQPNEISLRMCRTYNRKDFEGALALELNPISRIYTGDRRTDDGRLVLATQELKSKARLSLSNSYGLVASDQLKKRLKHQGLVGLVFHSVGL